MMITTITFICGVIYLFIFNPHIVTFNSINVILDSKNISMRVITSHLLVTLYILVLFKFLILVITSLIPLSSLLILANRLCDHGAHL